MKQTTSNMETELSNLRGYITHTNMKAHFTAILLLKQSFPLSNIIV